eukprot:TRINITY_DN21423_c0_g1_i5.p1 TRINITY_DN21423_c0_g1~~TRINITY_DN21423_c0_g1_i5.p1  ORF type:complete len:321 (-),score=60.70 TRINITY_DN21423_c0_g1_i5:379-1341(-)
MSEQEAGQNKRKNGGVDGSKQKASKRGKYMGRDNQALPLNTWGVMISSDTGQERRARQEIIHLLLKTLEKMQESQNGIQKEKEQQEETEKEGKQTQQQAKQKEQQQEETNEEGKQTQQQAEQEKEEQKPNRSQVSAGQALEEELKSLKSKEGKMFEAKEVSRGMTYLVMKKIEGGPSPVELCYELLKDMQEKGESQSRFCLKMVPITETCFASMEEITKLAKKVVDQNFSKDDSEKTFSIHYDHRFGPELERMAVIDAFATLVPCPPYKVDLGNPDVTIIVQVVKNSCGVSVVHDWKKLMKYNLREIVRARKQVAQEAQQ